MSVKQNHAMRTVYTKDSDNKRAAAENIIKQRVCASRICF